MSEILRICILCTTFLIVRGDFESDCLNAHNEYRKKHHASALKLDPEITSFADEWAKTLSAEGKIRHRGKDTQKYGENLYMTSAKDANCKKAVKAWYDEIEFYDFDNPGFAMKTGHFTQVVWKKCQFLGCAKSTGDSGTVVVCNYNPKGNMQGAFKENVLASGNTDRASILCSTLALVLLWSRMFLYQRL